jgi:hypothetical protein
MVDALFPTDRPAELVCPWCSASVTPETAVCPSCRAILISGEVQDLPGVTAVDQTVVRGEKKPAAPRHRLLSWISGDYLDDAPPVSDTHALAPPDLDVQREILMLELEAEVHNLQAEADANYAEAVVEGRVADLPEGFASLVRGEAATEPPPAEMPAAETGSDALATGSDALATGSDALATGSDAPATGSDEPPATEPAEALPTEPAHSETPAA